MRKFVRQFMAGSACLSALLLTSCDKIQQLETPEIAQQVVAKAEKAVTKAADVVRSTTGRSGSIAITLDQRVNIASCFGALARPGHGRPAVLRAASYQNPGEESFPSVYLHVEVPDEATAKLKGKVVRGQLFVQYQPNGPVWQSPHDQPIELQLSEIDEGAFKIEIVSGELVSTGGGKSTVTGKFEGLMR